jgi:hypothetical protein
MILGNVLLPSLSPLAEDRGKPDVKERPTMNVGIIVVGTVSKRIWNSVIAMVLCCALVWSPYAAAVQASAQSPPQPTSETKIPNEQLDSLVAPIALYADPLLSQILVACTYPLEIVQLSQWMKKKKASSDKLLEEVKKEKWDPSVQALVVFPDLVKNLTDNIKWTDDMGNAFLAQQSDVMDAVQRMRLKAKDGGKLVSSEQQKVETKVIEGKTVVMIQPSSTEVVYVPSYDPTYVWGAPAYPYPAYYYPPAGYYAAGAALSFGVGMMVGAAWGGGGWGWGAGWGGNNNVYVNHNNNFVNNSNRQNLQGGNRVNAQGGRSNWQHNPQHRGGAPYSNRATANRYGGTARGDSMANRSAAARQNPSNFGNRQQGNIADRSSTGGRGGSTGGAGSGRGGGDRVGNQSLSSGSGSRSGGALSSGGSSRSSSRASSSRGASSMGGSRGGGMRGGGGGRRR